MYSAYFSQCRCFIARFGDWKYLYTDIPDNADWILNGSLGKSITMEEIQRAIMQRDENQISSIHFSSEKVQSEFNDF
jgi:hypothetical protein